MKKLFLLVPLVLICTSCNSFNTVHIVDDDTSDIQTTSKFPWVKFMAPTGAAKPPTVAMSPPPPLSLPAPNYQNGADFDAAAEGKRMGSEFNATKRLCPVFQPPALPPVPPLPFKKLADLTKGDTSGMDTIQEEHIMELRRNIFVTRKILEQSFAAYVRACDDAIEQQRRVGGGY